MARREKGWGGQGPLGTGERETPFQRFSRRDRLSRSLANAGLRGESERGDPALLWGPI